MAIILIDKSIINLIDYVFFGKSGVAFRWKHQQGSQLVALFRDAPAGGGNKISRLINFSAWKC